MLHSLFSQVNVSLNEKLGTPSKNTYAYRAYLETLLSYGQEAKSSQLTSALWYKDTAGHMESVKGNDNKGWMKRKTQLQGSNLIDMIGKLHVDMMFQERYLPCGVNVKIILVRSSDAFVLMADGENPKYKIMVTHVALFVWKVKLSDTMSEVQLRGLQTGNAKYPIHHVDTVIYSVPQGNLMGNQDNLFMGQLPKCVVIGCDDNDAFNGSYHKNPFNFQHYDINFVAFNVYGQQVPGKPLLPNFEKGKHVRSYHTLFTALNKFGQDEGNQISWNNYAAGYTLFAFDLSPDLENDGHFDEKKSGPMRVEIHFA